MVIGIIGYGKMGREISTLAEQRGHKIHDKIDVHNADSLLQWRPGLPEVAIEFTGPEQAFRNIKTCIDLGIPVVSGTTGWLQRKPELDDYCRQMKGTYFYASNFSLGVNIAFKLNGYLARIMNNYPGFNVSIEEIHHTEKKDAPSGTAITLAEGIINNMERITGWQLDNPSDPQVIPVTSKREGTVPGTHTVRYESHVDEITLQHKAYSREGFALGAIMVAEWLPSRTGVLSMDDFLQL